MFKNHKISERDRFFAMKLLETKLNKIPDSLFVEYVEGWSDDRILQDMLAQSIDPKRKNFQRSAISCLRVRVFGRIRPGRDAIQSETAVSSKLLKAHNDLVERLAREFGEDWLAFRAIG